MMLEENQRTLISMSELVFFLNRDLKELKFENENLQLKEELKQKETIVKISEEQLKKYRKEEKKREEISKVLGETIKEMKNKE